MKKALEIAGIDTFRNRHSSVRWDRRSYRVATTEMWGGRSGVFRKWATDIVYLLESPAENVYWNCHVIYRLGCWNNASEVAEERHHRQDW